MKHAFLKKFLKDFEHNPETQFKFHRWAMYFWVSNVAIATALLVWFRPIWDTINIYYVALISLYANFDTDFDAMSASIAAIRSNEILRRMSPEVQDGGIEMSNVVVEESKCHVAASAESTSETLSA